MVYTLKLINSLLNYNWFVTFLLTVWRIVGTFFAYILVYIIIKCFSFILVIVLPLIFNLLFFIDILIISILIYTWELSDYFGLKWDCLKNRSIRLFGSLIEYFCYVFDISLHPLHSALNNKFFLFLLTDDSFLLTMYIFSEYISFAVKISACIYLFKLIKKIDPIYSKEYWANLTEKEAYKLKIKLFFEFLFYVIYISVFFYYTYILLFR